MDETFVLEAKDFSVGYNKNAVIPPVTFAVKKGTITTILGPNGSGKTTLLKSLARQIKSLGGTLSLAGKNCGDYTWKDFTKNVSVLLTDRIKTELLTCRDVVAMARYSYTGFFGMLKEEDEKIVSECLSALSLLEIADRSFCKTSDGQKQRVLIARALCQKPQVLLLDEPTSYLDPRYKIALMELLKKLAAQGLTIIMSLHEIELAQKVSDNLLFVSGEKNEFFAAGEFSQEKIDSLFSLPQNSYDSLLCVCELPAEKKEPEVFVISSGGSGIPVYRELAKRNIPFACGILYENDIDYRFAKMLSSALVSERPFEEISDEAFAKACSLIDRCEKVIDAGVVIGSCNTKIKDLLSYAGGKLCQKF